MPNVQDTFLGSYFGRLILEPLPDGRLMRLIEPFGFAEANQKQWPVPVGTKVDGASIPQPLWSIMGGPFEGKYRDASVVHDYYCDVRTEPWRLVHQVFYAAMRTSGVSESRAKLMYAAVYFAGPRWSETVVDNARLSRGDSNIHFYVRHSPFELGVLDAVEVNSISAHAYLKRSKIWPAGEETMMHLDQIDALIASENPSIAEIEKAIDGATSVLERSSEHITRNRILIFKK